MNTGKEIRWQSSKDSLFSRGVGSWSTWLVLGALRNCFCEEVKIMMWVRSFFQFIPSYLQVSKVLFCKRDKGQQELEVSMLTVSKHTFLASSVPWSAGFVLSLHQTSNEFSGFPIAFCLEHKARQRCNAPQALAASFLGKHLISPVISCLGLAKQHFCCNRGQRFLLFIP